MSSTQPTLSIDIGGTRVKLGIVQNGIVTNKTVVNVDKSNSFAKQLDALLPVIQDILQSNGIVINPSDSTCANSTNPNTNFGGIGFSFPGIVNPQTFSLTPVASKYLDAGSVDIREWTQKHFRCPVVIENDAISALLGELAFGCGKGIKDAVMLIIGTGLGTAATMDGKLVRGRNNKAGQLCGHMTINRNGRLCNCGNRGCLEAYAGGWAVDSDTRRQVAKDKNSLLANYPKIDFKALAECVAKQDYYATKLRDVVIEHWATLLANLIRAYDPELIILSGGAMNSPTIFYDPLTTRVQQDIFIAPNQIQFALAQDPETSVLLGLHHLLVQPK